MKITFPGLGALDICAGLYLESLGLDVIRPSQNTKASLEKGKAIAPEEMCLPFKLMAGNFIEAYERGARKALMAATIGPCRLGEYGELLKQVLDSNGYKFRWVLLDTPKAVGMKEFIKRLDEATSERKVSAAEALKGLIKLIRLIKQVDIFRAEVYRLGGYVREPQKCISVFQWVQAKLKSTASMEEAFSVLKRAKEELNSLPKDKKNPIKVLLTGEIYSLNEPFANLNIESKMMELGVSVEKRMSLSWWAKYTFKQALTDKAAEYIWGSKLKKYRYMPYKIGGYARETVEEIYSKKKQVDGVIKIMPSGCMPEIVAKSVCETMSAEEDIKILNLVFDEISGQGGYDTRVEAFVDMLERSRRNEPISIGN